LREKKIVLRGRSVVKGVAEGKALVSKHNFAFAGGVDPKTGVIIDERSDVHGEKVIDKVLVFPYGKGSTMGGIFFLENVRCGSAPAAIVNIETEPILASAAIMAEIFYKKCIPIVDEIDKKLFETIQNNSYLRVDGNRGQVEVKRDGSQKRAGERIQSL
jgi:predicted aconitase with swiveling domain